MATDVVPLNAASPAAADPAAAYLKRFLRETCTKLRSSACPARSGGQASYLLSLAFHHSHINPAMHLVNNAHIVTKFGRLTDNSGPRRHRLRGPLSRPSGRKLSAERGEEAQSAEEIRRVAEEVVEEGEGIREFCAAHAMCSCRRYGPEDCRHVSGCWR